MVLFQTVYEAVNLAHFSTRYSKYGNMNTTEDKNISTLLHWFFLRVVCAFEAEEKVQLTNKTMF